MEKTKKILITEDHSIVSRGLSYLISLNFPGSVINQVSSLKEMHSSLATGNFTHLILDLNLGDGYTMEAFPELTRQYPRLNTLIYSMAPQEVYARKLLHMGASGFLSKGADEREQLQALEIFLHGGIYINKSLRTSTAKANKSENIFSSLSVNELRVVCMMLKGYKTKDIAVDFDVTLQTIAKYKSRIFKKLGTENVFAVQKLAELYNICFP